ncbi:hypothetical protein C8A01DRAFT_34722 [Parachaetomium inaequale]|uniref:Fungal N-terminal domain-containing protein n=1 Tax=Parachaetomium inaequale TaxID=2588326 RepID=A0AAN6PLB1_9PEZI|nr:hypothetical protein C8A01DRAFT_34722 [Parachaetomium inaequale]
MDPLSITASAVGLAANVLRSAASVKDAVDQFRDAPAVARDIEDEIKIVQASLRQVEAALQRDPQAVWRLHLGDIFDLSVDGCRDTLQQIEDEFNTLFGRRDWRLRIAVWWNAGEIGRLLGRLGTKKGSLMLLVQALSLHSVQEMQELLQHNMRTLDITRLGLDDMIPSYPACTAKELDSMASAIGSEDSVFGDRDSVISSTRFAFDDICFDSKPYRHTVARVSTKKPKQIRRKAVAASPSLPLLPVKETESEADSELPGEAPTPTSPMGVTPQEHEAVVMKLREAEALIRALQQRMPQGPTGHPLSEDELLAEFRNHANLRNRTPTALVSVSNRIVDTIQRAFQMHHRDGEHPVDIWVVFIQAPPARRDGKLNKTAARIHHARDLAAQCQSRVGLEYQRCPWDLRQQLEEEYERLNPVLFHYEFVFEGGIPERYLLHKVSLQTLMDRGLRIEASSTTNLRDSTASEFEATCSFEIGLNLGFWAQPFGARAPTNWIAHRWYHDCVGKYGNRDSEMDRGVDTALVDWWLTDSDFVADYEDFQRWREAKVEEMAWEGIEFWETWHGDGPFQHISDEGYSVWDDPELSAIEDEMWEEIEEEAVRIGL